MKNIIYRLQFRFENNGTTSEVRDSKLASILSSMEDIDTENQIPCPNTGSIIEIDGLDYEVSSKKFSFLNEGNSVFYTTIISLRSKLTQVVNNEDEGEKLKRYITDYLSEKGSGKKYGRGTDWYSYPH